MSSSAVTATNPPAGASPSDSRASLTYALLGSLLPFTSFIVALRLYARISSKRLGADDWVTLVSLVRQISVCLLACC